MDENTLVGKERDEPYHLIDCHLKVLGLHQLLTEIFQTAVPSGNFLGCTRDTPTVRNTGTQTALQSSPVPSLLVRVDGLSGELQDKDGRKKLLNRYVDATENGQPWIVAAETMDITTVKPLTLADLAVKDNLELDKKTVAGIFRVPPFMVGVGTYNAEEYKFFITSVVMGIAQYIQQELTAKLLWSEDMYFCFNPRSLYTYNLAELVTAGKEMIDRMAMRRNELRDWLGLEPDDEMDELLALENFIPANKLGDQKKLNGGDSE